MDLPDLLLIDKPAGISSFDVIRRLRKQHTDKIGERAPKLGHAGTLDPAATGLLLIGVGQGTKQLESFLKLDKEYLAEVLVGTRTTSGDLDGAVLESVEVPLLNETTIEQVVTDMVGEHDLTVPAYSAIKQHGVPMYERARAAAKEGRVIEELPIRRMQVTDAACLNIVREDGAYVITVRFTVTSGTYIRSLAEELGRRLGYPATLKSLRRTKIGIFDVMHAKRIEDVDLATVLSEPT